MAVDWHGPEIVARIRQAAMRGVVGGTELLRTEVVRLIQSPPKTGKVYRRRGVSHQASAPGEAPATDTGRLAQSISTDYSAEELRGTVAANTAYAAFLEFGTSRMEPRPFMRPAMANTRDGITKLINDEVAGELERN